MTVTIKEKTKKKISDNTDKDSYIHKTSKDRDRIYNQLLKDVRGNNHNFDISHEEYSLKVRKKKRK